MDFLEYPSVSAEVRGAMVGGNLKINDTEVVFKHSKSGKKDVVKVEFHSFWNALKVKHQGSDIELVNWQRLAGAWGVRVFTKDGELHRWDFPSHLFSNWNLKVCGVQGG